MDCHLWQYHKMYCFGRCQKDITVINDLTNLFLVVHFYQRHMYSYYISNAFPMLQNTGNVSPTSAAVALAVQLVDG